MGLVLTFKTLHSFIDVLMSTDSHGISLLEGIRRRRPEVANDWALSTTRKLIITADFISIGRNYFFYTHSRLARRHDLKLTQAPEVASRSRPLTRLSSRHHSRLPASKEIESLESAWMCKNTKAAYRYEISCKVCDEPALRFVHCPEPRSRIFCNNSRWRELLFHP